MTRKIHLTNATATLDLGVALAKSLSSLHDPPSLLLQGDLGSGKTTLVRGLVESLPGSENAEVSSPSFNILNLYPTTPPVAHFDLYRLEGLPPDDTFFEFTEASGTLAIVEWIQFLDEDLWPVDALHLVWEPSKTGRTLTIRARGKASQMILDTLPIQLQS